MSKILIKTENLFIGDILFASSVAEPLLNKVLKSTSGILLPTYNEVHFCSNLIQPLNLLSLNPHIKKVFYQESDETYDETIILGPLSTQGEPATIQFQRQAGVYKEGNSPHYTVYTDTTTDYIVSLFYKQYRDAGKKIITYQNNWIEKSFGFNKEEYWAGINHDPLGYGNRRRDIPKINSELEKQRELILIPVGMSVGYSVHNHVNIQSSELLSLTASMIKMSDVLIGSEGGITNCGSGTGTRCIITTDFIAQLYGKNGCIRKHNKPTMGPATYFPERGHVHLNPYLTDDEVISHIRYHIDNPQKYQEFDWSTL
jgi:hypothetical protein